MVAFDEFLPASFAGLEFAIEGCEVRGGLRDHLHEYPHSDLTQPEKLGRRPYTIEMSCIFTTNSFLYEHGFPDTINALRVLFDSGITDALHVPHIGTMQAYAVDWSDSMDPRRMRSGVRTKITFREDTGEIASPYKVAVTYSGIRARIEAVLADATALEDPDLLESLDDAFNQIDALGDQANLAANQVASKIDSVSSKVQKIDEMASSLSDPAAWPVVRSLHNLGVALSDLKADTQQKSKPTKSFTTPKLMGVSDVARDLYGDSARAVEVLQLNAIDDAFAIPANTTLTVYAA